MASHEPVLLLSAWDLEKTCAWSHQSLRSVNHKFSESGWKLKDCELAQCIYSHLRRYGDSLIQTVCRIIARPLTLALDSNIRLRSCLLALLPRTLDRQGSHCLGCHQPKWETSVQRTWQCSSGVLQALGPFCLVFALILNQVYNTTDGITSPILGGKSRKSLAAWRDGLETWTRRKERQLPHWNDKGLGQHS